MNFSERINKCFTAGYSQSVSMESITDQLLSLQGVEVKLENETNNVAEYSIIKPGGNKIASVTFDTNNGGTMTVTEINDIGEPLPSITSINHNYIDTLTKLKEIIKNRTTKNFGKVKNIITDLEEIIDDFMEKNHIKISGDKCFDLAMEIGSWVQLLPVERK